MTPKHFDSEVGFVDFPDLSDGKVRQINFFGGLQCKKKKNNKQQTTTKQKRTSTVITTKSSWKTLLKHSWFWVRNCFARRCDFYWIPIFAEMPFFGLQRMVGRAEGESMWKHPMGSLVFLHQNRMKQLLGGGNSNIFGIFHPDPWGNDPIWRACFSKGLKPPTRLEIMLKFKRLRCLKHVFIYNTKEGVLKMEANPAASEFSTFKNLKWVNVNSYFWHPGCV